MEESAAACRPHARISACDCRFTLSVFGCNKVDCATCAGKVGKERGERVFRKVTAQLDDLAARFPGVQDPRMFALHVLTLTIPADRVELASTSAAVAKLRRAAAELVEQLGAAGSCIIPHPVGDKDTSCRTFHPHFNVLYWYPGPHRMLAATDADRAAFRERVRRAWGDALGMDPAREKAGTVVFMRAIPRDQLGAIRFVCDYNARIFAGWRRWSPKWVQWFGEAVKAPPRAASCGCEHCHAAPRVRAEGWDECRRELAFLEQRQETGPPLVELLDGVELPGDLADLPFEWFHPAYIDEVLGRPADPTGRVVFAVFPGGLA